MKKQFALSFVLLALTLVLFSWTDFDVTLQDFFFDRESGRWMVSPADHVLLSPFFYRGFKKALGCIGGVCFLLFLLSFRRESLKPHRAAFLMLLLSLVFVPVIVAGAKQVTNEYCPKQVDRYGGFFPHVGVLKPYPADFVQIKKGKCYPAGHATGGFALMALYFCFSSPKKRRIGLAIGLTAGWLTGNYQMLRGEHFLSHTIVSMIASWIVILTIYCLLKHFYSDPASPTHADNN